MSALFCGFIAKQVITGASSSARFFTTSHYNEKLLAKVVCELARASEDPTPQQQARASADITKGNALMGKEQPPCRHRGLRKAPHRREL
ncbi:MAG TPA: hypothetical protein DCX06_00745 [Opitutae bacterium]|nr:hypothetical protein [Opitutae bacterium]